MEGRKRVGIVFPVSPGQGADAAVGYTSDCGKHEQNSYQDESIDDKIADVVTARGYILAPGNGRLVANLGEHAFRVLVAPAGLAAAI